MLLYNYPAVTGVNLTPKPSARWREHPNIAGIKETGTDTAQIAAYVASTPSTFAVMAGPAPAFYPWLCVGATGAILALACVAPEPCVRILQHVAAGRSRRCAGVAAAQITPLARLLTATSVFPVSRRLWNWLVMPPGLHDCRSPRLAP